ncbi:MAG: M56 family metallopeptidase [Acidobacteriota bacterium]
MNAIVSNALLTLSQFPELSLLAKATVILGIGLLAVRLAACTRASVRHLLLAVTFGSVLLLPIVALTAPEVPVPVPVSTGQAPLYAAGDLLPAVQPRRAAQPSASAVSTSAQWLWQSRRAVGLGAWALGSLLVLAPLTTVLWRLGRLRRTGLPWLEMRDPLQSLAADSGVTRKVDLVLHEDVSSPLTFGTTHPVILLPADAREWHESDLRRALVHELAHVGRGDWAVETAARAICAVWWFHPLVWVAWRSLSLEAERACDDAVVEREESMEYAEQLVSLARRLSAAHAQPTLGMANRSDLSLRVSSVLDERQRRGRAGLATVVGAFGAAALFVLAVAPVRAVAIPASDKTAALVSASPIAPDQSRRQRGLDRELYEAAADGDVDGINDLLAAGASVNAAIEGDGSPLIAAARAGRVDIVRLLLDKGADPNMGVEGDGSPLIARPRHQLPWRGRLAHAAEGGPAGRSLGGRGVPHLRGRARVAVLLDTQAFIESSPARLCNACQELRMTRHRHWPVLRRSPSELMATAVMKMHAPGKTASHGSVLIVACA